MQILVRFFSYFRDLTGTAETRLEMAEGATVSDLLQAIEKAFPALKQSGKSVLVAIGVDYQPRNYVLKPGDEVSIFPPVQGG